MTSNGSFSTTLSPTPDTLSSSQLLKSSISSLNSTSSRQASSQITKIYRQSSTLFLTRRLPESLSTILPVIFPPTSEENANANAEPEPAPISRASRTTRIKVWSLYLTILNAVVELDPEEGKQAFGSKEWRGLVNKVRDGDIWEEVVKNGYGGVEGDVDSDVVINLATLLLAHARTQKTNQQRLEAYLAASTNPNLDISPRIASSSPFPRSRGASPSKNGTDTPRDLNARVKILELYTLHVLLRNNEWDYAKEFISISPVLDEERREAFLQALQSLQEEQQESERREREERRYQEEHLKRDIEDAKRRRIENEDRERKRQEEENQRQNERDRNGGGSEIDYGVEDSPPRPGSSKSRSSVKGGSAKASSVKGSRSIPASSPTAAAARSSAPAKKAPPTLITRAGNVILNVKKLMENMAVNFQTRPMFLMQILAFVVGLLILLSRRDVKERVKKMLEKAWVKVRQTAGMGVKVSYI